MIWKYCGFSVEVWTKAMQWEYYALHTMYMDLWIFKIQKCLFMETKLERRKANTLMKNMLNYY